MALRPQEVRVWEECPKYVWKNRTCKFTGKLCTPITCHFCPIKIIYVTVPNEEIT